MYNRNDLASARKAHGVKVFASLAVCFLITLNYLLFLGMPVRADMGPKPSIKVTIENPPSSDYYVALVSQAEGSKNNDAMIKEFENREDIGPEENHIREIIYQYNVDDFSLYICPLRPQMSRSDEDHVYSFTYMVPSEFKVILVTMDGTIYTSPVLYRYGYNCTCTYDVKAGTLVETTDTRMAIGLYLVRAALCFLGTIIIELLIMLAFSLSVSKNFKPFIFINFVTQVLLNGSLLLGDQIRYHLRARFDYTIIAWFAAELVIIVIESTYYAKRLQKKNGSIETKENVAYGLCANIVSVVLEIPIYIVFMVLAR